MRWPRTFPLLTSIPTALLFAGLFGPVLFAPAGHAPATQDADFYIYYFPITKALFATWRETGYPLWNPYIYSGMPTALAMEAGLLYPPNWLHLVLPAERAFCVLFPAHILLAAAGAWWYARGHGLGFPAAMFSATAFAFAAPTILHFDMGLTSLVYSSAWLPLLFALVDRCVWYRRWTSVAALAGALACQFLAGFPMFTMLLAVLIPAYLLVFAVNWRRPFARETLAPIAACAVAAALAFGLVLPQLWPAWEGLQHVVRAGLSYDQATHCSFPLPNLWTLVSPRALGDDRNCAYWGEVVLFDANAWCGVTTVLLAVCSLLTWRRREVWFWWGIVLGVTSIALGKDSAVYDVCFLLLPGLDRFRGISRLMIFADLGLAILAGLGLEALVGQGRPRSVRRLSTITLILAIAAAAALGWMLVQPTTPEAWTSFFDWVRRPGRELNGQFVGPARDAILEKGFRLFVQDGLTSAGIVLGGSLAMALLTTSPRHRIALGPLFLLLLVGELYSFHRLHIQTTSTAQWGHAAREVLETLPHDDQPFRVAAYSSDPPVLPNRLLYERIESAGGHENFVLERYATFLGKLISIDPALMTYLTVPSVGEAYDALNVKYYLRPRHYPGKVYDRLLCPTALTMGTVKFDLYQNDSALPRAFLVHEIIPTQDLEQSIDVFPRWLKGGIGNAAIVEAAEGVSVERAHSANESVHVSSYSPGRISLDVHCAAPALLVCVENYSAGWRARVDGQPATVHPANVFMTAVPVPAGDHKVQLVYEPPEFFRGLQIAAVCGGVLIAGCAWSLVRRWRVTPVPSPTP